MKKLLTVMACVLFLGSIAGQANAELIDYDYSGNLTYHNDVLQFRFTVDERSEVTLFSSSWRKGGFDPIMAIWDAAGNKLQEQDDGNRTGSVESNGVTYEYGNWDSYFKQWVDAGEYIITIAAYNNWSKGNHLSAGFDFDNQNPRLTEDWYQPPLFGNGYRTSSFEFHILGVNAASGPTPTPEPGTMLLMAFGLGAIYMVIRRKRLQEHDNSMPSAMA